MRIPFQPMHTLRNNEVSPWPFASASRSTGNQPAPPPASETPHSRPHPHRFPTRNRAAALRHLLHHKAGPSSRSAATATTSPAAPRTAPGTSPWAEASVSQFSTAGSTRCTPTLLLTSTSTFPRGESKRPNRIPSRCDDGTPQDQKGHGTWTASLAAAAIGPSTGQVISVAPAATILNIKVLQRMPATLSGSTQAQQCESGEASGFLSWVMQGIEDAIAHRADVISLYIGATADFTTGDGAGLLAVFNQITYAATQANIVLVASAGNDGIDLSDPAMSNSPPNLAAYSSSLPPTPPAPRTPPQAQPALPARSLSRTTATTERPRHPCRSRRQLSRRAATPPSAAVSVGQQLRPAQHRLRPSHRLLPQLRLLQSRLRRLVQAMGTSASAPLAASAAALLRAAHPNWSADTIVTPSATPPLPSPACPSRRLTPPQPWL
jgi:subtilisin family serine protease